MKILWIGPYRDTTGWAQASLSYILAADLVGLNIVCRPIKLNDNKPDLPERIKELESKSTDNIDICIQHCLPHHFIYDNRIKRNICLFVLETEGLGTSNWLQHIKLMPEIWSPSIWQKEILQKYTDKPIHIVPHAFDPIKFALNYEPFPFPHLSGKCVFIWNSEFSQRKNLQALLRAFHTVFDVNSESELIVKTSMLGHSAEQSMEKVKEFCNEIRKGLKTFHNPLLFKPETIITQRLEEQDMYRLYKSAHFIVNISHGEGWNIPLCEAMGLGIIPITTAYGPVGEYCNESNSLIVQHHLDRPFACFDTLQELYTGIDTWSSPNVVDLGNKLKEAYNLWRNNNLTIKQNACKKILDKCSYQQVGNKIKEILQ